MKIAVTGASGFLGQHVVRRLLAHPAVDHVVTSSRSPQAIQASPGRTEHIQLDLANADTDAFAKLRGPDVLIHLAWSGLPNYRSLHHFESVLPHQYAFLKRCIEGGLRSLLVTGTCYEYGMAAGECVEETLAAPTNAYAHAKQALSAQLALLQAAQPFELTWARLFYTHGAGQAATSLLPQLFAAVARGDTRFPMSAGDQLRDYMPVEQLADTLVALALRRAGAGVVNVCSGEPQSVRALIESVLRRHGFTIELELGRYARPDYEPLAFWGSRRKLDALLAETEAP